MLNPALVAERYRGQLLILDKFDDSFDQCLLKLVKQRKAIAEIAIEPSRGWVLPKAWGSKKFHYQAYAHFEKDETWGRRTWTLLVDLAKMPDIGVSSAEATVYFMVQEAPHNLLEEGAKFELLHGENHYTHGVIKRVFEAEK